MELSKPDSTLGNAYNPNCFHHSLPMSKQRHAFVSKITSDIMDIPNNVSDILFSLKMKFLKVAYQQNEDCYFFNEKYRGPGIVDFDIRFGRENGKFFREIKVSRNNLPRILHVHIKIIHAKAIATIRTEYATYRNCSH